MLKWTSESEYFLSFENFFADTIYNIIQSKSNHFTPSAAHARRGVIKCAYMHNCSESPFRGLVSGHLEPPQFACLGPV